MFPDRIETAVEFPQWVDVVEKTAALPLAKFKLQQ
jgi:hypothetical protein